LNIVTELATLIVEKMGFEISCKAVDRQVVPHLADWSCELPFQLMCLTMFEHDKGGMVQG